MDETGFLLHWPGRSEATNADALPDDLRATSGPVLVEFWAARCSACRRLAPQLEALATAQGGTLRLFTLNVDDEPEAALAHDVFAIPALLLFVEGQEVARWVGAVSLESVRTKLSSLSQSADSPL